MGVLSSSSPAPSVLSFEPSGSWWSMPRTLTMPP